MSKSTGVQLPDELGQSSLLSYIIGEDSPSGDVKDCLIYTKDLLFLSGGCCLRLFEGTLELFCAEVPEFEDVEMSKQAGASIRSKLEQRTTKVEAVFIFQSLASDIKLERELVRAKLMYGSEVLNSIIAVITDPDLTPPEVVGSKMKAIDKLCTESCISWVIWSDDCSDTGHFSIDQIVALRTALSTIRPYEIVRNGADPRAESHPGNSKEVPGPLQVETSMNRHPSILTLSDSEVQKCLDTVEENKQEPVETTVEQKTAVPYSPPHTDTVQPAVKRPIQRGGINCPYKLRELQSRKAVVVGKTEARGAEKKRIRSARRAPSLKKQNYSGNQANSG